MPKPVPRPSRSRGRRRLRPTMSARRPAALRAGPPARPDRAPPRLGRARAGTADRRAARGTDLGAEPGARPDRAPRRRGDRPRGRHRADRRVALRRPRGAVGPDRRVDRARATDGRGVADHRRGRSPRLPARQGRRARRGARRSDGARGAHRPGALRLHRGDRALRQPPGLGAQAGLAGRPRRHHRRRRLARGPGRAQDVEARRRELRAARPDPRRGPRRPGPRPSTRRCASTGDLSS